jgi:hypothetical protein
MRGRAPGVARGFFLTADYTFSELSTRLEPLATTPQYLKPL